MATITNINKNLGNSTYTKVSKIYSQGMGGMGEFSSIYIQQFHTTTSSQDRSMPEVAWDWYSKLLRHPRTSTWELKESPEGR